MPVASSSRSANVDLPWSMWAMMQKFRMRDWSNGAGAVGGAAGDNAKLAPGVRRAAENPVSPVGWRTGPSEPDGERQRPVP